MKKDLVSLTQFINAEIEAFKFGHNPQELYEPMRYIMALGGKRLRPALTLLSYSLYKDDAEYAIKPALAMEIFHNFTLMHDDIMDRAPLRRGEPTIHEKWNDNVAILSGDVMLLNVYKLFEKINQSQYLPVLKAFSQCAIEVCEGQQIDMNFENRMDVTEAEYLEMIGLKTAVLLGFCLELGALLADADEESCKNLRDFGLNMGLGFQLKDDLLDVYGDQEKFGKQVGGDIISNKKTFLLIKALELSEGSLQEELDQWLSAQNFDPQEKVKQVTLIYDQLKIRELTEKKISFYFDEAFGSLDRLKLDHSKKVDLRIFAQKLIKRES